MKKTELPDAWKPADVENEIPHGWKYDCGKTLHVEYDEEEFGGWIVVGTNSIHYGYDKPLETEEEALEECRHGFKYPAKRLQESAKQYIREKGGETG